MLAKSLQITMQCHQQSPGLLAPPDLCTCFVISLGRIQFLPLCLAKPSEGHNLVLGQKGRGLGYCPKGLLILPEKGSVSPSGLGTFYLCVAVHVLDGTEKLFRDTISMKDFKHLTMIDGVKCFIKIYESGDGFKVEFFSTF